MIGGRRYEFGVSGLLYKRNLLLFDRQTDSLWSQLLAEAVTGPLAGTHLLVLPAENTTWEDWKNAHPETRVLSLVTGSLRNYKEDPYAHYPFPRHPALLILAGGKTKIYPFSELRKDRTPVVDELGGIRVSIAFDRRSRTAEVKSNDSTDVTSIVAFLDDLKAFHPEAQMYKAQRR